MFKTDARTTATDNSAVPSNHFTHTCTHPLRQNSHPRLPTGIPAYKYNTPSSVRGETDETPHQKHNNHITCACPAPSKLTPPLIHPNMIIPENSTPLAAESLYPSRKLTTTGTGETRRARDNRDHSLTSNPTKTAESLLQCCHSASRRGNTGFNDRPNF